MANKQRKIFGRTGNTIFLIRVKGKKYAFIGTHLNHFDVSDLVLKELSERIKNKGVKNLYLPVDEDKLINIDEFWIEEIDQALREKGLID